MKKFICLLTIFLTSFFYAGIADVWADVQDSNPSHQANTGFLPDLSEFNIDIEKPKKDISNSLNTAKPLRESFKQAIGEIKNSLTAVKENRNDETLSKLHRVFSDNIVAIERKMVGVIKEKDRISDAFTVIEREFGTAEKRLESKLQEISSNSQLNSNKINELNKKASELARKYQEEPTDELKDELYQLKKQLDVLNYNNQKIPGQLEGMKRALVMVEKQGKYYSRLGNHVGQLLDKLNVEREKFSSAAEVCNLLLNITVASRGISADGTSVQWGEQVQDVWNMVNSFSGIMDEVTSELTNFLASSPDETSLEMFVTTTDESFEDWITKQAEKSYY